MPFETGQRNPIFARIREQGVVWISAHFCLYVWDKFFDFVLYPLAIIQLGLLWGTAAMMTASLFICLGLIVLYDRLSQTRFRDLLGFESLKEAASAVGTSRLANQSRLAQSRMMRFSAKFGLFVYLSAWFDPMTCTICMRSTSHYQMTPKYWTIFGLSVVFSNTVWALLIFFGVETIQALFELI